MNPLKSIEITSESDKVRVCFLSGNDLIEMADPGIQNGFIEEVQKSLQPGMRQICFDMAQLNRINSALLGVLVQLQKDVQDRLIQVKVKGANATIRKVMELTRLQHFLLDEDQSR